MSRLPEDLRAHRTLRDAAWKLVQEDVDFLRADLKRRGIGRRMADRARLAIRDTASGASLMAHENKGLLAGMLAALGLWLMRKPLLARIFAKPEDRAGQGADPASPQKTEME